MSQWAYRVEADFTRAGDGDLRSFLARFATEPVRVTNRAGSGTGSGRQLDKAPDIVEQARLLFTGHYAHLNFKRARHAVSPVRRLDNLRRRLEDGEEGEELGVLEFHREMAAIFASVKDRHMNYAWPAPFKRQWAWLGFEIEEYGGKRNRRYLVSRVHPSLREAGILMAGDEIRYWDGVPIERAVRLSGARNPGSNREASRAVGLSRLTLVPLAKAAPPEAEFVQITYRRGSSKADSAATLYWQRLSRPKREAAEARKRATKEMATARPRATRARAPAGPRATGDRRAARPRATGDRADETVAAGFDLGLDFAEFETRLIRGYLHPRTTDANDLFTIERLPPPKDKNGGRAARDEFPVSYLRLFSFFTSDVASALEAIRRGVHGLGAQSGLVIDIRDNPGGAIVLAELLLQALSPVTVEPERFQFPATHSTRLLCNLDRADLRRRRIRVPVRLAKWQRWGPSIRKSLSTGEDYSQGLQITRSPPRPFLYQPYIACCPLVLITNARSYSAADMFAAGFKDNRLGKILGTRTGAGGASVLRQDDLVNDAVAVRKNRELGLKRLPAGSRKMSVAVRRSLRVGAQAGLPLEDHGVEPDVPYDMTRADLLHDNRDLKDQAADLLRGRGRKEKQPLLFAELRTNGVRWTVELKLKHLESGGLEFFLLRGGRQPLPIPREGAPKLWPGDPDRKVTVTIRQGDAAHEVVEARATISPVPERVTGVWVRARAGRRVVGGWVLNR